jgi:hypothetical protein
LRIRRWQQFVQGDVRQPDRPALAAIHEVFHCSPCIEQSHAIVVNDIAVAIPRVLVVAGLKCKWSVNEIEIQIAKPKSVQTGFESGPNALGPVIAVPQLCGNEDVFPRNSCSRAPGVQRLAYLALVPVSLSAIEVPKPSLERVSGRGDGQGGVGNQGAEAECGHVPGSAAERDSGKPKIRGFNHESTSGPF